MRAPRTSPSTSRRCCGWSMRWAAPAARAKRRRALALYLAQNPQSLAGAAACSAICRSRRRVGRGDRDAGGRPPHGRQSRRRAAGRSGAGLCRAMAMRTVARALRPGRLSARADERRRVGRLWRRARRGGRVRRGARQLLAKAVALAPGDAAIAAHARRQRRLTARRTLAPSASPSHDRGMTDPLDRIAAALERLAPPPPPPADPRAHPAYVWRGGALVAGARVRAAAARPAARHRSPESALLANLARLAAGARRAGRAAVGRARHRQVGAGQERGRRGAGGGRRPRAGRGAPTLGTLPALFALLAPRAARVRAVRRRSRLRRRPPRRARCARCWKAVPRRGRPMSACSSPPTAAICVPRDIAEQDSAINPRDAVDDQLALADRFGLSLGFHALDQDGYLAIVAAYAAAHGLPSTRPTRSMGDAARQPFGPRRLAVCRRSRRPGRRSIVVGRAAAAVAAASVVSLSVCVRRAPRPLLPRSVVRCRSRRCPADRYRRRAPEPSPAPHRSRPPGAGTVPTTATPEITTIHPPDHIPTRRR